MNVFRLMDVGGDGGGEDRGRGRSGRRRRGRPASGSMGAAPVSVGDIVGEVSRELAPPTVLAAVQAAWPRAAGPAAAAEASPVSERDGIVTIACHSAVWAQELEMLKEPLLAKLQPLVEPARIVGLKFTAGGAPGA